MLEGFVSQLLADYLSNYIKDIQPEQFRIGIWNGVALLENAELRLEAFDFLQLPFSIKEGIVGRLKLQVPWKKLAWEPILIVLEDVFICACPRDDFEWNAEALEGRAWAAKKAKLAAAELAKLSAKLSQHVSDDSSGQSFLSYLSAKIIDNIQVTIRNVHFRYINRIVDPKVKFSFGITFTGLTVSTSDSRAHALSGLSMSGKARANQLHKLVEIKSLSAYWNSEKEHMDIEQDCNGGYLSGWLSGRKHERVDLFQPFDVSLRFWANKTFPFDGSTPQYVVVLDINDVSVSLEDRQLHEMLWLWDAFSICKLRERYGCFRPSVGQPGYNRRGVGWQKIWWHYAIQAVLVDVHKKLRRSSWSFLEWRMARRRRYINLYKSKLECLQLGQPTGDGALSELEGLEKELDLDEILSFRSIAENQLQLGGVLPTALNGSSSEDADASIKDGECQPQCEDQPLQKQRSWLNFLSLGMLGAAGSKVSGQFAGVLPDEIMQDICEATKYHPIGSEGDGDMPKGHCRVAGSIHIGGISATMRSLILNKEFIRVAFKDGNVILKMWHHSASVSVTIKSVEAVDLCGSDSNFPCIFGAQGQCLLSPSKQEAVPSSDVGVVPGPELIHKGDTFMQGYSLLDVTAQTSNNLGDKKDSVATFEIEFLPESSNFDVTVKVLLRPLEFAYCPELIKHMDSFFRRPASLQSHQELILASLNRFPNARVRMLLKAEYLSMRRRISWQVHLQKAVLIFLESFQTSAGLFSVFSMESIQFTSIDTPRHALLSSFGNKMESLHGYAEKIEFDAPGSNRERGCRVEGPENDFRGLINLVSYDQYGLQAHNAQVVIASETCNYQEIARSFNEDHMLPLVDRSNLDIVLQICTLPDEPSLTWLKIHGNVPTLRLFISPITLRVVRALHLKPRHNQRKVEQEKSALSRDVTKNEQVISKNVMETSTSLWEWKFLVSQLDLVVRSSEAGEAHIAVLNLGCMEVTGLVRSGSLEYLKLETMILTLSAAESSKNDQSSTLIHEQILVSKQRCNNMRSCQLYCTKLLKCKSSDGIQPALKLEFPCSTTLVSEVFISFPCAEMFLHLTAWFKVVQALTALRPMSQTFSEVASDVASSINRCSDQDNFVNDKRLSDKPDYCEVLTSGEAQLQSRSLLQSCQYQEEHAHFCPEHVNSRNTTFRFSILVLSVFIPDAGEDQVSQNTYCSRLSEVAYNNKDVEDKDQDANGGIRLDLDYGQGKNMISFFLKVQVDELIKDESKWMVKATIINCKGSLKPSHDQDSPSLPFLQITEVGINGIFGTGDTQILCVTLAMQLDVIDIWCSYAILHFLKSFNFERLESGSDPLFSLDIKVSVDLRQGSMMLSDGRWSCDSPIFEVLFENMLTQTRWTHEGVEFFFSSELEINNHNMEKVAWEPLLEPWKVSFRIARFLGSAGLLSRVWCTKAKITSSSELNINVTNALAQATARAVEMVQDSLSASDADGDSSMLHASGDRAPITSQNLRRFAPYWFQNDTGVAITYWLVNAEDTSTTSEGNFHFSRDEESTRKNIVEPGCLVPLYTEENPEEIFRRGRGKGSSGKLTDKKHFSRHHRMISVQLEGSYKASLPMSIDLVGSRSFDVLFSHSVCASQEHMQKEEGQVLAKEQAEEAEAIGRETGFCTPVVFDVSVQHYSKLIRIFSTVTLLNTTSMPLEVRFDIPFGISPKVMEPVLAGHVKPLPVHLAETGRIRWRPMGNKYLWSEAQSLSNILQLGSLRSVVCYPAHPSDAPVRSCITVEETRIPAAGTLLTAVSSDRFGALGGGKNEKNRFQAQQHLKGKAARCSETGDVLLRQVTFQAPLVFKNCLPISLSLTIESGSGVVNISAPSGDTVFIFEVHIAHDLSFIIHIPGFLSVPTKFSHAIVSPELDRAPQQKEKISFVETLIFNPEAPEGMPVNAKLEKVMDTSCGAREVSIYVPFWLYNCSEINLGITDGAMEMVSGKGQQFVEKIIYGDTSVGNRDFRLLPENPGLEAALQLVRDKNPCVDASSVCMGQPNRCRPNVPFQVCKCQSAGALNQYRKADFTPGHSCGAMSRTLVSQKNFLSYRVCGACPQMDERQNDEVDNIKPYLYSPYDKASEETLRVRIMPSHFSKDKALSELSDSVWSRPFPLNPPGGIATVVIPHPGGKGAAILSAVSVAASGACAGITRTITFRPRFVLANGCMQDLCYKQHGTDVFQRLLKGGQSHLHCSDTTRDLLVSIRFDQHGWDWSGGFVPDQLGDTQLKVRNHATGALQMVRVEVHNAASLKNGKNGISATEYSLGTYLIIVSDDDSGFMPYRIDNFSLERLRFYQQECEKFESILLPYSSCSYAWDEPWRPHQLVLEVPGEGQLGVFNLDEVKNYPNAHLSANSQKSDRRYSMSVHAEGPIRVLTIQDMSLHLVDGLTGINVHGFKEQLIVSEEEQDCNIHSTEELTLSFSSVGLSIIDLTPQEIVFGCAKGVIIQLLQGPHQQRLNFQVDSFQVDNQLRRAQYPVMMSAGAQPSRKVLPMEVIHDESFSIMQKGASLGLSKDAAFTMVIVKWRHLASSVNCFQQVNVRMAPVRLELDEQVVYCLLGFFKNWTLSANTVRGYAVGGSDESMSTIWKYEFLMDSTSGQMHFVKVVKQAEVYRCWPSPSALDRMDSHKQKLLLLAKEARKVYVEVLKIAPVELTVSFSSTPWLPQENRGATAQSLWITGASMQRGLMAFVDVEGAPIHLRQLTIAHPLASWNAIKGMIVKHYTRQLLHEVYKILGSAGVFGNPMGFMRSLGSGIKDFVSAPARSLVQSPTQFAKGLAQGTQSLISNTVLAVGNTATQMSRATQKGVTAFALDHEYAVQVERRKLEHGSWNYGVLNELLEGLTGLLQSPIVGAKKHGLPGILSGVAVGALGLVGRPMASILEVAGRTALSIRSWIHPGQLRERRIRPPRHLSNDGPLLPYSWEDAIGNTVIQEAASFPLKNKICVICKPLAQLGNCILLTESLLLKVRSASLAATVGETGWDWGPEWSIDLEIPLVDILHIDRDRATLHVLMGSPRCQSMKKRLLKSRPILGPVLQESIEMVTDDDAKELTSILRILVDECNKAQQQVILTSRKQCQ